MKIHNRILRKNEKGATAVYAAVVLALLLGFAALGVDVNYLYGVRNELHNAADAGSLAGASKLFDEDSGDLTRDAAITEATRITSANKTGNENVVAGTVEIGHWSFAELDKDKKFTPSSATTQLDGWQEMSFSELDGNPAFINAVRVQADRSDTPSFFAKILGFDDFFVSADAVAYIGFAGIFYPGDFDLPFAVCQDRIETCNMGRVINSGNNPLTSNTGAWTNFTQDSQEEGCSQPVPRDYNYNPAEDNCGLGNKLELHVNEGIGLKEGMSTTFKDYIYPCWQVETEKIRNWSVTLPVITCGTSHFINCDDPEGETNLVGAVNVDILWMTEINKEVPFTDGVADEKLLEKRYEDAPRQMDIIDNEGTTIDTWTCGDEISGFECWKSFVKKFNIQNVNGPPADNDNEAYDDLYQDRSLFFKTECTFFVPTGGAGGVNTGVMAEIPKLVE